MFRDWESWLTIDGLPRDAQPGFPFVRIRSKETKKTIRILFVNVRWLGAFIAISLISLGVAIYIAENYLVWGKLGEYAIGLFVGVAIVPWILVALEYFLEYHAAYRISKEDRDNGWS